MGSTNSDSPWQPTKNDLPEDNLQHLGISFAEIEQNPVFLIITKREKEKAAGRTLRTLLLFGVMVLGAFTPLLAAYPIVFLLAVFRFPMLLFTGPFRCVSAVGISDSLTREDIGLLLDTPLTPEDYAIGTLGAILSRRNVDWTKLTYRLLGFASIMASVVCIPGFDGWSGSGLLSLLGSLFAVMFTWFCAAGIVSAQNTPECAIADLARRMRNRLGIPKFI
ncbi:hypothetical protein HY256_01190 [Candidatus Sumerlaeota bacterium]|nr:hypothetical protein [Candidatus Sumerlaeota bacterium]